MQFQPKRKGVVLRFDEGSLIGVHADYYGTTYSRDPRTGALRRTSAKAIRPIVIGQRPLSWTEVAA